MARKISKRALDQQAQRTYGENYDDLSPFKKRNVRSKIRYGVSYSRQRRLIQRSRLSNRVIDPNGTTKLLLEELRSDPVLNLSESDVHRYALGTIMYVDSGGMFHLDNETREWIEGQIDDANEAGQKVPPWLWYN